MSEQHIQIHINRTVGGVSVAFTATATSIAEALQFADQLAGVSASPVTTAVSTTKKSDPKGQAAKTESTALSSASTTPTVSDDSEKDKTDTTQSTDGPALTYDTDVKPIVLAISKINREWAVALLQRFGAIDKKTEKPSAQALDEDQWPAFIEQGKLVVAGKLDPTASDKEVLA